MPLADINTSLSAVSAIDPIEFLLTIAVFVVMVSVFTLCTCCGNDKSNRDKQDETVYGVVAVTGNPPNPASKPAAINNINFRPNPAKAAHERHSQPVTNMLQNMLTFNRQSAPGRALPKLPADLYTAIDKKSKQGGVTAGEVDDIRFVDETVNPMYECIDAETDSFVDPLYSKVGEVQGTSANRDRKYDYPIFSGRPQNRTRPDETVYQSASQIYAPNSEDPYSSITSERGRNTNENDGDNSSAYDPGYAKVNLNVQPKTGEDKKKAKIEKTERELDLLYSKIRRNVSHYGDDSQPGPSNRPEPILPTYPIVDPIPPPVPFDEQSAVSSREPSYRYITMRENADVVRERLRQQGQLDQPRREHYYSTIGNEYETIANGSLPNNARNPISIDTQRAPLANISTSSIHDAPPPPTSPIPGRSRPVSYIETNGSGVAIPPPPDLRCSPVPPRPPGDDLQPHVFSISHASSSSMAPQRVTYSIDANDAYTLPTTNRPTSSFRSMETLLGKRTVEEKETIVEKRSTFATGVPIPHATASDAMSRSMDSWGTSPSRAVHEVPIRRVDRNYEGGGPSVDVIISGRRYRSGQGVTEDPMSSSYVHDCRADSDREGVESSSEKRRDRTKSCSEDEAEMGRSSRMSRNKKGWKEETEEERIKRLGTIYTANDYVSQMDMTDQKPWPMNGSSNSSKQKN
ncbi:Serine/arginine repetitive matrix protein 1 [Caenorhabditis elegans]|uniref:Serine/arginine repetitive matrix protein 1 n=1 Tax=Caenorhabditis elegans TaxID=6239 RepID=P90857_CAEEL|nr:Serine/arginine repetitive matrix protein 1 [Caenorhabditis elegans]CCD70293.2 Serine/arginine repetitive matrix protein 1 [Caenorhabditis elegans]